MSHQESEELVRKSAQSLIHEIAAHSDNEPLLRAGLEKSVKDLLKRPDLKEMGVFRKGNHISNSKYLYYDGRLEMTLDQFPKDKQIPPHDHGTWEALAIYSGKVHHVVYERIDDKSKEGYAELKIIDDRILGPGDIAMVVPPSEIHSFKALTDDTYSLTIVGDHYKPIRHYYNMEEKSVVVRSPKGVVETGM